MDEADGSRAKWGWIAAGAAVVLVGIGLVVRFDLLPAPVAVEESAKPVTFADGGTLEIIGTSVGERVVEISPAKRFKVPFFNREISKTDYYSGMNIDTELENGQVIRAKLSSDTSGAMLMEFRMKDLSGTGMKLPAYLTKHDAVFQDDRIGKKHAPHHSFRPQDDRVETVVDAMVKADLQLLVQHRGPQGGWIHLNGPSMFHEPWPDRYIVSLDAWQRSLVDLDFRAIRADGQVVEFSLPNPDFRKSPAKGGVTALPIVHNGGDYTLMVRQVERFQIPGNHPFAGVEMDFQPRNKPVPGDFGAALTLNGVTAEDEWGNRVKFEPETIRKKSLLGAFLPATSKRMTIHLRVVRTANSPRFDYTGFGILEGVVSEDGLRVDFTPGVDTALLGITAMPVGAISPSPEWWGGPETKDWQMLKFQVAGGSGEVAAVESRLGNIFEAQFLIFPEGGNESAGNTPWGTGGGGGQGGGKFHFKREITWLGSPEMLRPGATIRVGMFRPAKNDDLTFDLELPEAVQAR